MEEVISGEHAGDVTGIPPEAGQVWYITHFTVTHPKKRKLRVVFDCSAKYAGTLVNEHVSF